jgi:hypothetical protein
LLGSTNNLCKDLASPSVNVALPRIFLPGTLNTLVETSSKFCSASSLNEGFSPCFIVTILSMLTPAAGPKVLESISFFVVVFGCGVEVSSAAIPLASVISAA